ncbi:MAG: ArsO family NAD(P)H-dependent flavin-containing monooxygenase [Bacteroidota bacterium]
MKVYDTIVIGGGQAGLSVAYFLRRHQIDYLILDDQEKPGGAWQQTWDSLKLFSPVTYSSLSGWMMPKGKEEYPTKDEFLEYMAAYEKRYDFSIQRPTTVHKVLKEDDLFRVETDKGVLYSRTLVSATGSSRNPFIPPYENRHIFSGTQIHSVAYRNSTQFIGKKVLVVGGGNSGAQILAEVSKAAQTKWVTLEEPFFLPEDIDGRYLFNEATRKFYNKPSTFPHRKDSGKISLSNIVQVESVRKARKRSVYDSAERPFKSLYKDGVIWQDDSKETFDAIIWCTGFKANLDHLWSLNIAENDRIKTDHTRSIEEPNLWLVGYGSWTGFASATIYGVGKTARRTGIEIVESLNST